MAVDDPPDDANHILRLEIKTTNVKWDGEDMMPYTHPPGRDEGKKLSPYIITIIVELIQRGRSRERAQSRQRSPPKWRDRFSQAAVQI
ncbi:hypothetical protein EVAR_92873_1 [Eumeta japonica]|uniref:Uncharacterized protein n=1 Tax=Eumeta variegata TaxID=151549 RepID=A0A4C1TD73_EUMVA|nr:hypothetical protein EVAR_92873_1 [Eumeta japonica]